MRRFTLLLPTFLIATMAMASTCPEGDALLKNNTPLSQLCPNGFGQFSPGGIQNAINNQQNNTAMIIAAADKLGVPEDLALAVSYHESEGFNSCAGSFTGVKGPMQLTQSTGRGFGYDRDINEQNIMGGMTLLKQAVDACGASNYACISARYNGSTAAEQAGWARGVAAADKELLANPQMLANACANGSADCPIGPGGFDITTSPSASQPPAPAASDVVVGNGQV